MKGRMRAPGLWVLLGALGMMAPQVVRLSGGTLPVLSPASRGRIAFAVPSEGMGQEIAVMAVDGSARTIVSNHPGVDIQPAWSPDGRRIAFSSFREGRWGVYVMNADGTAQVMVADGGLEPEWSPDGSRIAFCRESDRGHTRSANHGIFTVRPDGAQIQELTHPQAYDGHPSWSPDGRMIAFHSSRSGTNHIYVMNADGSGIRQVTKSPHNETSPSWSPDGKLIAFESDRNAVAGDPQLDRKTEIYSIRPNGKGERRLTHGPGVDVFPAWSPNGKHIVFGHSEAKTTVICIMDVDGSNLKCISDPKAPWDYAPASWTDR